MVCVQSINKTEISVYNVPGLECLDGVKDNSIDLILTDPPYIISRDSGMNTLYNKVKQNEENDISHVKTEKEWTQYKKRTKTVDDGKKENYLRYGTIYGKKYCVKTDYGDSGR